MDKGEIIIYQSSDGQTELDVRLEGDSVWLSQAQMTHLFQRDRTVIGRHIANIYREGELDRDTSCAKIAHKVVNTGNDALRHSSSCGFWRRMASFTARMALA